MEDLTMSERFKRCMRLKRKLNNVVMNILSFTMGATFALLVVNAFIWSFKTFLKLVGVM